MNMNMSEKDKQTLVYVVAALVVFAAWFLGFRNFNAKAQEYRAKTAQLETRYNELLEKQKNRQKYLADTAVYNDFAAKALSIYADGHSLENTIKYIYEMEDLTEIFIPNFSIADGQVVYSFADGTKQGVKIPITFSYESTYDTTKDVIDYINNFDTKCCIDNMTISYDTENDEATGSVTMNLFAVITPESVEPEVDIDMPIGNENIFIPTTAFYSTTIAETGDYIVDDHDVIIQFAQPQADIASLSVGVKGSDDKPVTSKKNEAVPVEIVFSGTEGDYTVAYKVGTTSYPAKNYADGVKLENAGDTLDVYVLSVKAADAKDKVKADVTVINDTDKVINFKVTDDEDAKRFNIVTKTGRVKIFD